jgi:ATP-dependent DNA ligase
MTQSFTFPSSSQAGLVYTTLVNGTTITCNCPGYTKRSVRECKHTKQVASQLGITPSKPEEQTELFEQPTGFIKPMLASAMKEGHTIDDFSSRHYVMEEKYDGHRLIVKVDSNEVVAWSRQGNIRGLNRALADSLGRLPAGVYDGELCIPGGTSTDVVALDKLDTAVLYLFDLLKLEIDPTVEHDHLYMRRNALEAAFWSSFDTPAQARQLRLAMQHDVSADMLKSIWDNGGEGAILKHIDSRYMPGKRSKDWIKLKRLASATLTLVDFEEGLLGPHSKLVLIDDSGVRITVKALNDEWRAAFAVNADAFINKRVTISFQERTRDGRYRHPMADHFPDGEL